MRNYAHNLNAHPADPIVKEARDRIFQEQRDTSAVTILDIKCPECANEFETTDLYRCLKCNTDFCLACEGKRGNGYVATDVCPACLEKAFAVIENEDGDQGQQSEDTNE